MAHFIILKTFRVNLIYYFQHAGEWIFVRKLISLLYFITSGLFNGAANNIVVEWI
jgi:hypothetical protein